MTALTWLLLALGWIAAALIICAVFHAANVAADVWDETRAYERRRDALTADERTYGARERGRR